MDDFEVHEELFEGVFVIKKPTSEDKRGQFQRLFCSEGLGGTFNFSLNQANISYNGLSGTFRGLHYQAPPSSEEKLITCVRGKIFDILLDLRPASSTYLCWRGYYLTEEDQNSLLVPKGVAHGFQTIVDNCTLVYFHSAPYSPDLERTLNVLDPAFGIKLPKPITIISDKDKNAPFLDQETTE